MACQGAGTSAGRPRQDWAPSARLSPGTASADPPVASRFSEAGGEQRGSGSLSLLQCRLPPGAAGFPSATENQPCQAHTAPWVLAAPGGPALSEGSRSSCLSLGSPFAQANSSGVCHGGSGLLFCHPVTASSSCVPGGFRVCVSGARAQFLPEGARPEFLGEERNDSTFASHSHACFPKSHFLVLQTPGPVTGSTWGR